MDYEEWKEIRDKLNELNLMERKEGSAFVTLTLKYIMDHIQPERSKREDDINISNQICKICNQEVRYIKKTNRMDVLCRCGALNSIEI